MRAVWGLILMAMSVKEARTDPIPLKPEVQLNLQVEVVPKENQKVQGGQGPFYPPH